MFLAVAEDDLCDDVEQLGRHGDDAFAVALGRADDQERDNLAVGALVLPDAEVAQFGEFLGAQAGQPECLHDGPLPERGDLVLGDAYEVAGGAVDHTDRGPVVTLVAGHPKPRGAVVYELFAGVHALRGLEQLSALVPGVVDVLGEDRQQRLADSRAVGDPFVQAAPAQLEWRRSASRTGQGATHFAHRSGSATDQVCRSR